MHRKIGFIQRLAILFVLSAFCVSEITTSVAVAVTQNQFYTQNNVLFYDPSGTSAACAASNGTPTGIGGGATAKVPVNFSLGTGAAQRQVSLIKALMADYGLTAAQAAGVIGNFMVESGGEDLPPDINEGGHAGPPAFSGGYGWAQWTGGRQITFVGYAVKNGYMASTSARATDAANYAYLKDELNSGYTSTITDLKKQSTPEDAALSWERTFEKAGVPALGRRSADARTAFNNYNTASGGTATPAGGTSTSTSTSCGTTTGTGTPAIVGNAGFPLLGKKSVVKNPNIFRNGTTDRAGHPYTAFDILANPGTEIVAFMDGTVTHIGQDRCPGRLVSIYNKQADMVVSYLHMNFSNHVQVGQTVTVGQHVGFVGPAPNGCGIPHLHIDAAKGKTRPGCSRLNCPASNASQFIDIGPQLYQTFQKLPS